MANFIYKTWCHINRLNLTWWVSLCLSAAWTCWLFITAQLESDVLFSPTLWGATLPELSLLCPLPGSPPNLDPCSLACMSWALIISFSLPSWAISASMVSGESSDVIDKEEALGRLQRERLAMLDAEIWGWTSLKECKAFTHKWSCWGGTGWVTEEEDGKGGSKITWGQKAEIRTEQNWAVTRNLLPVLSLLRRGEQCSRRSRSLKMLRNSFNNRCWLTDCLQQVIIKLFIIYYSWYHACTFIIINVATVIF